MTRLDDEILFYLAKNIYIFIYLFFLSLIYKLQSLLDPT